MENENIPNDNRLHITTKEEKPLYDIRLNQNDLIEYVTTKEKTRVNEVLSSENKKLKKLTDELEKYGQIILDKLLEFYEGKEKLFFSVFKNHKFHVELSMSNISQSMQDEMYGRNHSYNAGRLRYDRYQKESLIPNKVALVVVKEGNIVCTRIIESPKKLKNELEKEHKALVTAKDEQEKVVSSLNQRMRDIESNSVQVKNKLIEEHLGQSGQGQQLLDKLNGIKLAGDITKLLK